MAVTQPLSVHVIPRWSDEEEATIENMPFDVSHEIEPYAQLTGNDGNSGEPAPQISVLAAAVAVHGDGSSIQVVIAACKLLILVCADAMRALTRAPFRETRTTDDRIPIMAITTKSSINVKPFFIFILA